MGSDLRSIAITVAKGQSGFTPDSPSVFGQRSYHYAAKRSRASDQEWNVKIGIRFPLVAALSMASHIGPSLTHTMFARAYYLDITAQSSICTSIH